MKDVDSLKICNLGKVVDIVNHMLNIFFFNLELMFDYSNCKAFLHEIGCIQIIINISDPVSMSATLKAGAVLSFSS